MNFETLAGLIGHSVHHPDVKALLKELGYEGTPVAVRGSHGMLDIPNVYHKDSDIQVEFTTRYAAGDDAKSSFTEEKFELVVQSFQFWNLHEGKLYPYSLTFGDDLKTVAKKLNVKPFTKYKGSSGNVIYYYYVNNFEIITGVTDEKKLRSFSIKLQDFMDKKKVKLQEAKKEQQKNITTANLDELRSLTGKLPTEEWLERMKEERDEEEGETPFTVENIGIAAEVLKEFINDLVLATEKKKAVQVLAAVKKTVKKFDTLNPKNDYFIETLEREDLVEFITKAVRLTGYKIEEGADITVEWREEW